jgi:ferredoxin
MALHIDDTCINCGACESVCPVDAISEGEEYYEIKTDLCVECEGHFDEPQCASVCPTDSCIKD